MIKVDSELGVYQKKTCLRDIAISMYVCLYVCMCFCLTKQSKHS